MFKRHRFEKSRLRNRSTILNRIIGTHRQALYTVEFQSLISWTLQDFYFIDIEIAFVFVRIRKAILISLKLRIIDCTCLDLHLSVGYFLNEIIAHLVYLRIVWTVVLAIRLRPIIAVLIQLGIRNKFWSLTELVQGVGRRVFVLLVEAHVNNVRPNAPVVPSGKFLASMPNFARELRIGCSDRQSVQMAEMIRMLIQMWLALCPICLRIHVDLVIEVELRPRSSLILTLRIEWLVDQCVRYHFGYNRIDRGLLRPLMTILVKMVVDAAVRLQVFVFEVDVGISIWLRHQSEVEISNVWPALLLFAIPVHYGTVAENLPFRINIRLIYPCVVLRVILWFS